MIIEVKNAVISDWSIRRERGFLLDMWVYLDYGGSGQGFGGWALYLDESATHHKIESIAGHFIYRVMQVALEQRGRVTGPKVKRMKRSTVIFATLLGLYCYAVLERIGMVN